MNLLSSLDLSRKQIEEIFKLAESAHFQKFGERRILSLLFEKPSTRTRAFFESAMASLGGSTIAIDSKGSQLSRGESLADTARVLSICSDGIAARMFRQRDLIEIAENSSVPVINALTDLEHPTQALGDVYTVREHFGTLDGVRIAFVGDIGTNTCNSLMVTATVMGASVALIGPRRCRPSKKYLNAARRHGRVVVSPSARAGLKGADVIYTDTFVSMGEEAEAEARRSLFRDYRVTRKMLSYADDGCVVMHCLPAHRGEEIDADVIDGERSVVWQQARNKLLLQKAVLAYLLK